MANVDVDVPTKGGFSFDLCRRNEMLMKKGLKPSSFLKTGTTIVGLVFKVCWFSFIDFVIFSGFRCFSYMFCIFFRCRV